MEKQTLILFGAELDFNNEIEILSKDKFGMDITIEFKGITKPEVRHNCTEFHHMFKTKFAPSSAYESDIHSTGGVIANEHVTKITVVKATKKNKDY